MSADAALLWDLELVNTCNGYFGIFQVSDLPELLQNHVKVFNIQLNNGQQATLLCVMGIYGNKYNPPKTFQS